MSIKPEEERDEIDEIEEICNRIYLNLKSAMLDKEESVANIAQTLDVDTSYIYAFYSGKKKPGLRTILKICRCMSIAPESIIPDISGNEHKRDKEKIEKLEELILNCSDDEFMCICEIIRAYNNSKKG